MSNVDFGSTRNQIIERALRQIGVIGENQNASAYQIQKGSYALNSLVKNLGLNNNMVWRTSDETFNTVASTASYTPTAGIIGVKSAFLRIDNADYPLYLPNYDVWYISEQNKSAEGRPEMFVWKDDPTAPTITLSPVPNAVFEVRYLAIYKLKDFDNPSDANLFPAHWEEVLVWNLAAALSFEFGIPLQERGVLMAEAKRLKDEARLDNWHHMNTGDIKFEPA